MSELTIRPRRSAVTASTMPTRRMAGRRGGFEGSRSDRQATVTDDFGRKRFELQPKLVRGPFELALAHVDALADPCRVLLEMESVNEVLQAYKTAPMSATARRVLEWRLAGAPAKEMARRLDRSGPSVYGFLREARQAVRDELHRLRAGQN